MTTKRTEPPKEITPKALDAFRRMEKLSLECECLDGRAELCAACKKWNKLDGVLHHELRLPPWEYPTYQNPADAIHPNPDAQERYRALTEAAAK